MQFGTWKKVAVRPDWVFSLKIVYEPPRVLQGIFSPFGSLLFLFNHLLPSVTLGEMSFPSLFPSDGLVGGMAKDTPR